MATHGGSGLMAITERWQVKENIEISFSPIDNDNSFALLEAYLPCLPPIGHAMEMRRAQPLC